jgi:hypothetical protein
VDAVEVLREWERVPLAPAAPRIAVESMAGRWLKMNEKPQWISRVDVDVDGDDLLVHVFGGGLGPTPADWGTARTEITYGSWLTGGDALAGAFVCRFELPESSIELQANLNLGLLVVATYVTFREPGPYANRFTREFFRRDEATA